MDVLTFGKYNGYELRDVPFSYLLFLAGFGLTRDGVRFPFNENNHSFNYVLKNHPYIVETAKSYIFPDYKNKSKYCKLCDRKLISINDDWLGREYHKSCWKKIQNRDDENEGFISDSYSPIGSPRNSPITSKLLKEMINS